MSTVHIADTMAGAARRSRSRGLPTVLLTALIAVAAVTFGAAPAGAANQSIGVADNDFTVPAVAVKPGESVTWTYDGTAGADRHNVHFDDQPVGSPAMPTLPTWTSSRTFPTPGIYRYHCDEHGGPGGQGMSGVVYVNDTGTLPPGAPTASFTVTPSSPVVDQPTAFSAAGSTVTEGAIVRYEWDFDGNGTFESDRGAQPDNSWIYTTAGTRTVKLRVTDTRGLIGETTRSVVVGAPPPLPPPVQAPPAPVMTLAPPTPRLGSTVAYRARPRRAYTLLTALSLRAARAGSTVRLSCRGRGCPFTAKTRRVAKDVTRLDLTSFVRARRLRPGTRLEIRVTKPGTIGLVRRLTIRAGRSPRSESLCVPPGAAKASACPA